jgi:hypothetical protein
MMLKRMTWVLMVRVEMFEVEVDWLLEVQAVLLVENTFLRE